MDVFEKSRREVSRTGCRLSFLFALEVDYSLASLGFSVMHIFFLSIDACNQLALILIMVRHRADYAQVVIPSIYTFRRHEGMRGGEAN